MVELDRAVLYQAGDGGFFRGDRGERIRTLLGVSNATSSWQWAILSYSVALEHFDGSVLLQGLKHCAPFGEASRNGLNFDKH